MASLLKMGRQSKASESESSTPADVQPHHHEIEKGADDGPVRVFTPRVFAMVVIVSMGGMIFGFDTGQISGFEEMSNFLLRFGNTTDDGSPAFTDVRSGTIVGLLSIGTLFGALGAGPISDRIGRRLAIIIGNLIFIVGVIVQIATKFEWYQLAIGRWVAGIGVGMLSVLTPMYQSETAPRQIRGALVSAYQLFITLGIFTAYCINYGSSQLSGPKQWRITMGVGFLWPLIMACGIMFLRESPRWDYRKGNIDRARTTIAKSYNVSENHWEVHRELREIKAKYDAENAGGGRHPWYEVFTGPRMAYRTVLGVVLMALQQLTGANYFFYYGTTIFEATGINNSFVTSMILGGVNFGMTFPGLYVVEHFGRRRALITGGIWMFVCFIVFATLGAYALDNNDPTNTPKVGAAMIVFACLFIAGYAPSWGPIIWAVIGELYPTRYRATAMGIATTSNWVWNFLISFFTPFITNSIGFNYGYIFAGCNLAAALVVYLFLCETQGKSLEEIDTMYLLHVSPVKSSSWRPEQGDDLPNTDALFLRPGARDINKADAAGMEDEEKKENIPAATEHHGIDDISGTGYEPEVAGGRGNSLS